MCYISAIEKRCDELTALGQAYLDKLPFMDNIKIIERLYEIAFKINKSDEENPEWVDMAVDGHLWYSRPPRPGSMYKSLAYSVVAQDAKLRNLLEYAEGREDTLLDFPIMAEEEIVDAYCEEMVVAKRNMTEDDVKKMWRRHRTALTKAKNQGDHDKIIAVVDNAYSEWEASGWPLPDKWNIFVVAKRDAEYDKQRTARVG